MQSQIHFPISQDHGALCPNMPWTSQRNFLSLHNFPKQNLRVKMYHSDPRRLGFNNHAMIDLTLTTLILKATHTRLHAANQPQEERNVQTQGSQRKLLSIHSLLRFAVHPEHECRIRMLCFTPSMLTMAGKILQPEKRHLTLVYSDCIGFFQITRQTPSPKFACDKLYIRLRSEEQWAEDRRGVRTKKRYEVDQATSYYYCSQFVDRTGNEILY